MDHTPSTLATTSERQSCFLRLPTEIRLQIYALLLLPREPTDLHPSGPKLQYSLQDSFDYEKKQRITDRILDGDVDRPTLLIRTIDGACYTKHYGLNKSRRQHLRSTYGEKDRFRAKFSTTTYHCLNNPRLEENIGILRTNRLIHAEAAELLYSSYTFDFDVHVEAMRPFLSDLTPCARRCVRSVRFVKRALASDREYDRIEWSNAMRFLTSESSNINFRGLELGIVAGKPGSHGWDDVPTFSASDFRLLRNSDGMQWLQELLELKGLEELNVRAVVEHCPPPSNSMAMAAFVRFSASVEAGFAQFLRETMLET